MRAGTFVPALGMLLFAVACGTGQLPEWKAGELTPAQWANAKRIAAIGQFTSMNAWEASPWHRIGDLFAAHRELNDHCHGPCAAKRHPSPF